jgi:hypothetical protein
VTFCLPECGTEIRLTLVLNEPPDVKVRCDENCEDGDTEGKIVNIGAGFIVPKDRLHDDAYFPSFDAPTPDLDNLQLPEDIGPIALDATVALGGLPRAVDHWRILQKALGFTA